MTGPTPRTAKPGVDPHPGTPASTRTWLARWLETNAELTRLQQGNPMLDAIVDEQDGRRIRIGDHWLADFASCNYLGFDLDPEIVAAVPRYLARWGTHPSWSRMLASPVLNERIDAELAALLGAEDVLTLPTITHISGSVLPALADQGTVYLDARAHKTIWDGCQVARGHGATVRRFAHDDPDELEALLRAGGAEPRVVCTDGVNSMTGNPPALQRRGPPPRRVLRPRRPGGRMFQGVLVAARVRRVPDPAEGAAQGGRAALPVLGAVADRLPRDRPRGVPGERRARRRAADPTVGPHPSGAGHPRRAGRLDPQRQRVPDRPGAAGRPGRPRPGRRVPVRARGLHHARVLPWRAAPRGRVPPAAHRREHRPAGRPSHRRAARAGRPLPAAARRRASDPGAALAIASARKREPRTLSSGPPCNGEVAVSDEPTVAEVVEPVVSSRHRWLAS